MNPTRRKNHFNNEYTVADGVWRLKDFFVNVYIVQNKNDRRWFLIDAGLKSSAPKIKRLANHLFGPDSKPLAIILTHAHFDHIGSLHNLITEWEVPVYVHSLERDFLTGESSYPPPDPSVGGGLMALMSWMSPKGRLNLGDHLCVLPEDGTIPGMPEWKYIYTPGHAPGHISLFRTKDKVLLAGDALATIEPESTSAVLFEKTRLGGPPKYFTSDWYAAAESVQKIADLNPEIIATGHGLPVWGEDLRYALQHLAKNFWEKAVPANRKLVKPSRPNEEAPEVLPNV